MGGIALIQAAALFAVAARPAPGCKMNEEGVLSGRVSRRNIGSYRGALRGLLRCPVATHVAVAGIHGSVADAQVDLAALSSSGISLSPGYPWVAHTDEMTLGADSPSGIAVVLAAFSSERDARVWAARRAGARQAIQIHALASDEDAQHRRIGNPKQVVVRLQPDGGENAISFYEARAVAKALGRGRHVSDKDIHLPARGARCRVRGGALFLVPYDELFPPGLGGRVFAPVRCDDGRVSYVPWTSTLLESVIWRDRAGALHLSQISAVFCDEPDEVLDWYYDPAAGRREGPRRLPLRVGCR